MKIIAIGGGGFTHGTYLALEEFCLEQLGRVRPRLGYIGAANQDDPARIARFQARFSGVSDCLSVLPMALDAQALADRLHGLDMVYVGGGNTEAMVAAWRANGWGKVLQDAAQGDLVLAGVSAGAVCWFEKFLYSSGDGPMRPLQGLGLVSGGACPHYSTETDRRAALHSAVADGTMPDTIAIDDGVALALDEHGPLAICAAEPGAGAYRVTRQHDGQVRDNPVRVSARPPGLVQ